MGDASSNESEVFLPIECRDTPWREIPSEVMRSNKMHVAEQVAIAQTQAYRARKVLKQLEWYGRQWATPRSNYAIPCCPICRGFEPSYEKHHGGHRPDCELAEVLGDE